MAAILLRSPLGSQACVNHAWHQSPLTETSSCYPGYPSNSDSVSTQNMFLGRTSSWRNSITQPVDGLRFRCLSHWISPVNKFMILSHYPQAHQHAATTVSTCHPLCLSIPVSATTFPSSPAKHIYLPRKYGRQAIRGFAYLPFLLLFCSAGHRTRTSSRLSRRLLVNLTTRLTTTRVMFHYSIRIRPRSKQQAGESSSRLVLLCVSASCDSLAAKVAKGGCSL